MLESARIEETLIRLPEGGLLATVERYANGLLVGNSKVKTDHLILSLLEMLDSTDIRDHLIKTCTNGSLVEIFGPMIGDSDNMQEVHIVFEMFMKRVDSLDDDSVIRKFFYTFASKVNLSALDEQELNSMLQVLLENVERLSDGDLFREAFLTLLKKVDICGEQEEHFVSMVLQEVLTKAGTVEHEDIIRSLFNVLSKKVDVELVVQLLSQRLREKRVQTPILPRHCVMYQEALDGSEIVAIEVERQQLNVLFGKTKFRRVGHPKLIFIFHVKRGKLFCQVVAVKDAVLKPGSKVFYFPFSNVHRHNASFRTCWPELKDIEIKDIYQLESLPYLFLNSPSNNDLYHGENLRELFEKLAGKPFDDSLLEDTGMTLADVLKVQKKSAGEEAQLTLDNEDDELYEEEEEYDETGLIA